jgi:hypothetical protein
MAKENKLAIEDKVFLEDITRRLDKINKNNYISNWVCILCAGAVGFTTGFVIGRLIPS